MDMKPDYNYDGKTKRLSLFVLTHKDGRIWNILQTKDYVDSGVQIIFRYKLDNE